MSRCKSCGAEVKWVKSEFGKAMILNAKTEKRIIIDADGRGIVADTYLSHFATCPNAASHRKKG